MIACKHDVVIPINRGMTLDDDLAIALHGERNAACYCIVDYESFRSKGVVEGPVGTESSQ